MARICHICGLKATRSTLGKSLTTVHLPEDDADLDHFVHTRTRIQTMCGKAIPADPPAAVETTTAP